jgi:hypothetical protein
MQGIRDDSIVRKLVFPETRVQPHSHNRVHIPSTYLDGRDGDVETFIVNFS